MAESGGDVMSPADAPARAPVDAIVFLVAVVLSVSAAAVAPDLDCNAATVPGSTTFEIVRAAALGCFFGAAATALLLRRRIATRLACAAVYAGGGIIALGALAFTASPC
jgi:hypothetical protein